MSELLAMDTPLMVLLCHVHMHSWTCIDRHLSFFLLPFFFSPGEDRGTFLFSTLYVLSFFFPAHVGDPGGPFSLSLAERENTSASAGS